MMLFVGAPLQKTAMICVSDLKAGLSNRVVGMNNPVNYVDPEGLQPPVLLPPPPAPPVVPPAAPPVPPPAAPPSPVVNPGVGAGASRALVRFLPVLLWPFMIGGDERIKEREPKCDIQEKDCLLDYSDERWDGSILCVYRCKDGSRPSFTIDPLLAKLGIRCPASFGTTGS